VKVISRCDDSSLRNKKSAKRWSARFLLGWGLGAKVGLKEHGDRKSSKFGDSSDYIIHSSHSIY
jgi:hypothetical protein